jgi:hypothetical protein
VVAVDCVKVAPLSTEKVMGMPLRACPDDVAAVAVAVTVAAPLLLMLVALSSRVRRAAVGSELLFGSPVNGDVPASPPPPPQDASRAAVSNPRRVFSVLFIRQLRQSFGLGLSGPQCGR